MNLTTIVGKTGTGMRMLCLAGLLSFPVVSLQASNISLTELGKLCFKGRRFYGEAGL